jgi:hypothetical protein
MLTLVYKTFMSVTPIVKWGTRSSNMEFLFPIFGLQPKTFGISVLYYGYLWLHISILCLRKHQVDKIHFRFTITHQLADRID